MKSTSNPSNPSNTSNTTENLEYICDIKDATSRVYKGYFNPENNNYYIEYGVVNTDGYFLKSKPSHEIYYDLCDPFAELKLFHDSLKTQENQENQEAKKLSKNLV